jgi:chemotaxis protein methyltransferase WspC
MDLVPVQELLKVRIGLDPASAGPSLTARAIRSRMKAVEIPPAQYDRYLALLNGSRTELDALIEEVVVPESWFFRDVHPFALLTGKVVDRWRGRGGHSPFRVLSVPCARGEEPYSIAIALREAGLAPSRMRIDAVDISASGLESARRGHFRAAAFRTHDVGFRDRYFREDDDGYLLNDEIRSSVHFLRGNLVDPHFFSTHHAYDVIFCRNLLIYLTDTARRAALANLDRLLAPEGVMFVGHAEQLEILGTRFSVFGNRNCFAFARSEPPSVPPRVSPKAAPGRPSVVPAEKKPRVPAVDRKPDSVSSRPRISHIQSEGNLAAASQLAGEGKHTEAVALCEREIRMRGPSAQAFYLLGVIRQAIGDGKEAVRCLEKAVYLDPGHEDALLNLSLLARRRGDHAAADNYQRRAQRAFQEKPPS